MNGRSTLTADWRSIDNIKIAVPILAGVFAIIFDVGLFTAVGLGWFSVFTFSEHLLIAIESSPFVVITLVIFYINLQLTSFFEKMVRRDMGFSTGYVVIILSFLAGTVAVLIYTQNYFGAVASALAVLFVIVLAVGRAVFTALFAICISVACAFGMGLFVGVRNISEAPPYILFEKSGFERKGVLFAAGDRGVLFFDSPSGTSQFFKWDDIRKIERQKPSWND